MEVQQVLDFSLNDELRIIREFTNPMGYKGISAVHKYWGKKPIECLRFLIEAFSTENDIILDPFLGSGIIAPEALRQNRKFIGIDINPISVELSKLMLNLPDYHVLESAFSKLESEVKQKIYDCYKTSSGHIATHYLYCGEEIESVWTKGPKNKRVEQPPDSFDIESLKKFENYEKKHIGDVAFFENSRINTHGELSIYDLFTKRALYCIDILMDAIYSFDEEIQRALLLLLTSSSGQMSKMVFAITNRGKNTGKTNSRIEVGSWAIGYWRPERHFEINVWNCYRNKANRLLRALKQIYHNPKYNITREIKDFFDVNSDYDTTIVLGSSQEELKKIPDNRVGLVVTDPPHGDRIPYLEMSSMWNAILNIKPNYSEEIVVSNAKSRAKDIEQYNKDMQEIMVQIFRVLKPGGILALIFNSADPKYWDFIYNSTEEQKDINFIGSFPMHYSAASLVQDNRKGALRQDYVLIYAKTNEVNEIDNLFDYSYIPGWSDSMPI